MTEALRILVPTDGSPSAQSALRHVLDLAARGFSVELHLVNVQPAVRGVAASLVSQADLDSYHREEAMKVLEAPASVAREAGLTPHLHVGVGEPGDTILAFARQLACSQIVMGSRGFGSVSSLLLGSVARHVVGAADLPVTLLRA